LPLATIEAHGDSRVARIINDYSNPELTELRTAALDALLLAQPQAKCAAVRALVAAAPDPALLIVAPVNTQLPGRPPRPQLVSPGQVAQRGVGSEIGRAALLHALAHIEFCAINLALDAVWRFEGLPPQYYRDWTTVAIEEATHFSMLLARLQSLGHAYGDFDAHDGLWEMAEKTRDDPLARMALVPRLLEARGLDASPPMRDKLLRAGDPESGACIDVILRDEIGHVAIGNRWFHYLCAARRCDTVEVDAQMRQRHGAPPPRPPFNFDARRRAGFSEAELAMLRSTS
jgi:uncharacterized ferritin-like protein (DUF455 family)